MLASATYCLYIALMLPQLESRTGDVSSAPSFTYFRYQSGHVTEPSGPRKNPIIRERTMMIVRLIRRASQRVADRRGLRC